MENSPPLLVRLPVMENNPPLLVLFLPVLEISPSLLVLFLPGVPAMAHRKVPVTCSMFLLVKTRARGSLVSFTGDYICSLFWLST